MHTTLSQAHPDYWTVTMINFQSHKKKEFPNKKKEFTKKKEKKKNLLKKKNFLIKKKNFLIKKKNFQIKKKEKKKKIISFFPKIQPTQKPFFCVSAQTCLKNS